MRTLLALLFVCLCAPAVGEVIWSQDRDFYVDPPEGWTFVEDPTPEHFVMTDPTRKVILEIFSQDKATGDLKTKAGDLKGRLAADGDEVFYTWGDRPAWLADWKWTLRLASGSLPVEGWAFVADDADQWVSALAYTPADNYAAASDVLVSALDSLALGSEGRREPGPLTEFFRSTAASTPALQTALKGLPTAFTLSYDPNLDEAVQTVVDRETRLLLAQLGPKVTDQKAIAPSWSRFYRQIYRSLYSGLQPLAAYWQSQLDQKKVSAAELPQKVLSWLQSFTYARKGGLTDLSTPWQTLKEQAGDCDSRALVYLALLDQLGYKGILMVSAPYSHSMAALDLAGPGARFSFEGKSWLVAELTATVSLGQIAQDRADPAQWLGIDLWGKP